ncbi:Succinate-semialdehyde dehydrogenase, mitochondrial [Homalodisca vitripennis]|nr:Succinate-semialdehyde dehydrogenase, mitochondrial [Homalodisca vitripennis]
MLSEVVKVLIGNAHGYQSGLRWCLWCLCTFSIKSKTSLKIVPKFKLRSPACTAGLRHLLSDIPHVRDKYPGRSGKTFEVTNPATTQVIASVPDMDVTDTETAIAAANEAFQSWGNTTAKWVTITMSKSNLASFREVDYQDITMAILKGRVDRYV